jgi:hypothetical protein
MGRATARRERADHPLERHPGWLVPSPTNRLKSLRAVALVGSIVAIHRGRHVHPWPGDWQACMREPKIPRFYYDTHLTDLSCDCNIPLRVVYRTESSRGTSHDDQDDQAVQNRGISENQHR